MKFAAIASAAALVAVANAQSACDVTSLETLLTSSDTTTCASASGYTVTSLATPTDAEMALMCTSTACQSVLSQLETLAPSECTLGTFALYADLITPLTEYCSGGSTASSSATAATVGSTAGSSTSATVTTSSTGSAASTTTTSSGSSTSETATSSSSAASAAASASTSGSSGASMAAVSAGAVLAAVAATFF
jgi:hypothetical protein